MKNKSPWANKILKSKKQHAEIAVILILSFSQISCVVSSSPNVQEIVETQRPTIMGGTDVSLSASSSNFNITGNCDTNSYGTEYTVNGGSSWVDLGACTTGTFSFNVIVYSVMNLEVRSRTKFAYTQSSIARIRVIIPPTANLINLVTASSSDFSSLDTPTLSFTMSPYLTGSRPSGATTYSMDLLTTGISYAQ